MLGLHVPIRNIPNNCSYHMSPHATVLHTSRIKLVKGAISNFISIFNSLFSFCLTTIQRVRVSMTSGSRRCRIGEAVAIGTKYPVGVRSSIGYEAQVRQLFLKSTGKTSTFIILTCLSFSNTGQARPSARLSIGKDIGGWGITSSTHPLPPSHTFVQRDSSFLPLPRYPFPHVGLSR